MEIYTYRRWVAKSELSVVKAVRMMIPSPIAKLKTRKNLVLIERSRIILTAIPT